MELDGFCLLDTNVLLRISNVFDPENRVLNDAAVQLSAGGTKLCCALQNVAEYWNVSTRPLANNGFGLSPAETSDRLNLLGHELHVLPEPSGTFAVFRNLLITHQVRGVQVHDARLAAVMIVNGISQILTFNDSDFTRYSGINAINPRKFARP